LGEAGLSASVGFQDGPEMRNSNQPGVDGRTVNPQLISA